MQPIEVLAINEWPSDFQYDEDMMSLAIETYRGIAQDYCNQVFLDGAEPMGVKKFIASSIKLNGQEGLAARSMGSVSYSFITDLPSSVYKTLQPYRAVRW